MGLVRDWKKCFICQEPGGHDLKCPAANPVSNDDQLQTCYTQHVHNILHLKEMGDLPECVLMDSLFSGHSAGGSVDAIVQVMISHKELVWHKSCRSSVNSLKLQRATKRRTSEEPHHTSSVKTRCLSSICSSTASSSANYHDDSESASACFICEEVGEERWGGCHKAATLGVDAKVWKAAKVLGEQALIRKLSEGDMIAVDAVYHLRCLSKLYRRAEAVMKGMNSEGSDDEQVSKELALSELIDYIESFRGSGDVIEMTDVCKWYDERLVSLGICTVTTHTTRLRETIVSSIPDLKPIKTSSGQWNLMFDADLGIALNEIKKCGVSEKMAILVKTAKALRDDFLATKHVFTGSFTPTSEADSIPRSLKDFLGLLIDGPKICTESEADDIKSSAAVLSIGQLIIYNSVKQRSRKENAVARHPKEKETPLPLYLGIKTNLQANKATLDKLHDKGVAVSYDRVRSLSTDIANSIIGFWDEIGVVVPPQAVMGCFTTMGFDNADWNAKSTLAKSESFLHGTLLAVHQHFSDDSQRLEQNVNILRPEEMGKKHVKPLPTSYTEMDQNLSFSTDEKFTIPRLDSNAKLTPNSRPLKEMLTCERTWLKAAAFLLKKQNLEEQDYISW